VLDIAIHKTFTKEIKKAKLNPTNTAKLFMASNSKISA